MNDLTFSQKTQEMIDYYNEKLVKWDKYFLSIAAVVSVMSKDPSTKIGAVIVDSDRVIRATGFNGFPRGIEDTPERLNDRETKYKLVVHAEVNAILAAARVGVPLIGCTLYLGSPWGGPPCHRCCVDIIQAGIVEVVSTVRNESSDRWSESLDLGQQLLEEAGVRYREVSFD